MKYWTMNNGGKIKISEMSDTHLINSVKMIERLAKEGLKIYGGQYYGEGEDDFWEDEIYGKDVYDEFPAYKSLWKEVKNRKLSF
jgi:hypothetical protein